MPPDSYQIRLCPSCGLRYPLTDGNNFGTRCPACLGETRLLLTRSLLTHPARPLPDSFHREGGGSAKKVWKAALLDNVRSAWNVGSIFRSADGFGFAHAYLCGITPTPESEAVRKTSLGAEDNVTWSYHKDALKLANGLKKEGWQVWSLEADPRAISISTAAISKENFPVILIVGNEITGVDPGMLDLSDRIFYIPMHGEKTSFNVAIAFGIAAYQFAYIRLRA